MRRSPGGAPRGAEVSATLSVRVLPRSSKEEVAGLSDGAVRIRLSAPPLENRANEALIRFLSEKLEIPRRRVELVAGARGRRKTVRVEGMPLEELLRRLGLDA